MTNKEYREHEGISKSQLWKISKSPMHFKYALEHPQEDTEALLFGRAAHKYILERDDFFNEFAVAPKFDRRTKEGKAAFEAFAAENSEKEIIPADKLEMIKEMSDSVDANPTARLLLTGECETSWFWTDSDTGEACKCRPDCLTTYNGRKYIVDYKTTDSCENGLFEHSVKKYGYKLQAGMYREGMFQNTLDDYGFVFVAQEKSAPYAVRVYFCSPEFLNEGYDTFRTLLGMYHDCKINNNWYGYQGRFDTPCELLGDGERKAAE